MSDILTTNTLVSISDFYDRVIPEIPGHVLKLVDQAILDAAYDFCSRARVWRESINPLTVVAGEPQIEMDFPTDAEVFELAEVYVDGLPILPTTEDEQKKLDDMWYSKTGRVEGYMLLDQNVIRLYPIPETTINAGLTGDAYLRPSRSAEKLPSLLRDKYDHVIGSGAKAALMAMVKKPWSSPERAMQLQDAFESEIGSAGWRSAKNFTKSPLRVTTVHK